MKLYVIFTLLACTVLTFLFSQVILNSGLTGDDWQLLFAYKTFDPHPFDKALDAWMIRGPYTTIQFYYIGILESLFGINYQLFQIINICFKIFASITLFILIYKLFRSYFLASSAAIIFSIIHSSAGAFKHVVKGSEYLAIAFMNLFFLSYYFCVTKKSMRLTILSSIILFLTFILSPIRIYPILGLIILIEIYLIFRNKKIRFFFQSFTRLLIFYMPIIFLAIGSLGSFAFVNDLKTGNWYFSLAPLEALGYTLLGNDQLKILGISASLLGIFLIVLSSGYLIIWIKRGSKLNKFFLLFFGPFFAFFFLIATWIFQSKAFHISDSVHWYLIIPSMGISLFIAGLLCLFYELWIKFKQLRYLFIIFFLFFIVALVSFNEINRYFNDLLSRGTGWKDQSYMQNQVLGSLTKNQLNVFVYFEGLHDPRLHQFYAVSSNLGYFEYWMLYFKKPNFLGCVSYVTERNQLIISYNNRGEYFEQDGLCAMSQFNIRTAKTRYNVSEFRAFRFKDKKIFNITQIILEDLKSKKL
ncbi:MAG: hypothetical protein AAB414_02540 [Patescibacteria group bacterium]